MREKVDTDLLVRVSKMYYLYGNTQAQIAQELGISRSMISYLLTQAKKRGIVEVKYIINNPQLNHDAYARRLERIFGVQRCVVIPSKIEDSTVARQMAAERAGEIFNEYAGAGQTVGISWGNTCHDFLDAFHPYKQLRDLLVVPLIGGIDLPDCPVQMNEMVRLFAQKTHGTPAFIYAPAIAQSAEERDLYMQSSQMQAIEALWDTVDVALVAVGNYPDLPKATPELLGERTVRSYRQAADKPAGDLCARRFNLSGEILQDEYDRRIIGIPVDKLQKIPTVIGVAAGVEKTYAIYGALRTRLMHVFVCDANTAKSVLALEDTLQAME